MRIAVDAAILIRGNARASGPAKDLLQVIPETGSRLVLSPYILGEIDQVLRYPRIQALYHLSDGEIRRYFRFLESIGDIVDPAEGPGVVLKDPNDDPVVYTALAWPGRHPVHGRQTFFGNPRPRRSKLLRWPLTVSTTPLGTLVRQ